MLGITAGRPRIFHGMRRVEEGNRIRSTGALPRSWKVSPYSHLARREHTPDHPRRPKSNRRVTTQRCLVYRVEYDRLVNRPFRWLLNALTAACLIPLVAFAISWRLSCLFEQQARI